MKKEEKHSSSIIQGIAVQLDQVSGGHNLSLSAKDVCGMIEFGLALCGQIREADNTNTGKVIAELVIGSALFGGFFGLLAANIANRVEQKKRMTYQYQPIQLPILDNGELEAKTAELARLYHLQ